MVEAPPPSENRPAADDVRLRSIGVGAALVAAAIAFSLVATFVAVNRDERNAAAAHSAARPGTPPPIAAAAKLQPEPVTDAAAYRTEQQRLLDGYAWVDRERGIVRIPIERAMAIAAGQIEAPEPSK